MDECEHKTQLEIISCGIMALHHCTWGCGRVIFSVELINGLTKWQVLDDDIGMSVLRDALEEGNSDLFDFV